MVGIVPTVCVWNKRSVSYPRRDSNCSPTFVVVTVGVGAVIVDCAPLTVLVVQENVVTLLPASAGSGLEIRGTGAYSRHVTLVG